MCFPFLFFFSNLLRLPWWKPGPTEGETTTDFGSTKIHLNWLCLKVRCLVQDNHLGSFYSPCRKILAPPASIRPACLRQLLWDGMNSPPLVPISLSIDYSGGWRFELKLTFMWLFFSCEWQGRLLAMWWHSLSPCQRWGGISTCCNIASIYNWIKTCVWFLPWPQGFPCEPHSGGLGLCLALATCWHHCVNPWQISEAAALGVYIYAEQPFAGFC